MSGKKVININPEFFSLSGSNKTRKKSSSRSKSNKSERKKKNQLIKPNKAKKELLRKIKQHQKAQRENKKKEQHDSENIVEFTSELNKSMNYIQNIINENRKKREQRKTQKNKDMLAQRETSNHIHNPVAKQQSGGQPHIAINTSVTTPVTPVTTSMPKLVPSAPTPTPKPLNTVEPPYGCLKGGKKPTFSQYKKTLKNKHSLYQDAIKSTPKPTFSSVSTSASKPPPKINMQNLHLNKQHKLGKHKNGHGNGHGRGHIHSRSNNSKSRSRYKRIKHRTLRKTYKLGKNHKKRRVGILIKNNKTRKRVKNEIGILSKTPMPKIKKYLREKNLLKFGSKVPDHILKETFINSMLSGDIKNKNSDVLIHNYFKHT
jgi:hypothetical protein